MIIQTEHNRCTGCGACAAVCPKQCIAMQRDSEGFDYPVVDTEHCVNCNLCHTVCPVGKPVCLDVVPYTVCVQNKDESVRACSSAGGFVGAVFEHVFHNGGVAFGAAFDQNNIVYHRKVCSMEEALQHRVFASKYVGSRLGDVFSQVKEELEQGRMVCFVGLPCQVAGLHAFLRKPYDQLVLIDLTCYGVPSPKIYEKYLEYIEQKFRRKIRDVRFRDKTYGYSAPTFSIELDNGRVISQNSAVKSYLRLFFSHMSMRPSCHCCDFKNVERVSEFTVGDCKNIGEFVPNMNDDKGTTVVHVHTEKGANVFSKIAEQMTTASVSIERIIESCGAKMVERAKPNPRRDAFFGQIDSLSYEELVKRYCPAPFSEKLANCLKTALKIAGLHKSGILRKLKRR